MGKFFSGPQTLKDICTCDVKAYDLANILSARLQVGAPCSDGSFCSIWSEKVEDRFLHIINGSLKVSFKTYLHWVIIKDFPNFKIYPSISQPKYFENSENVHVIDLLQVKLEFHAK